jgi:hypothetical protein
MTFGCSLKIGSLRNAFLERRTYKMATVIIQKRMRSKGMRYPTYYKDPVTGRNKYYKTYRRLKDAQDAANELTRLLDAGKLAEVKNSRKRISLLNFEEVCRSLRDVWKGRHERSELSDTTYRGYCDRLKLLDRGFGDRLLCEISRKEILGYRNLKMTDRYAHLTSMRKLSKQVDLARFYENHGCVREPSGGHIWITKGENESLNRKRAD